MKSIVVDNYEEGGPLKTKDKTKKNARSYESIEM